MVLHDGVSKCILTKVGVSMAVGSSVPWINDDWFKIYQLHVRQSSTNEGFDPGMCHSDSISTIGRLANVS